MRGLDITRCRRVVAHRLAKLPDAGLEDGIADIRFGPHGLEQFLLGDELAWVFDQELEDRKRFRPQGNRLRTLPEAFVRGVQSKSAERVLVWPLHHGNITVTKPLRYDCARRCPVLSTHHERI